MQGLRLCPRWRWELAAVTTLAQSSFSLICPDKGVLQHLDDDGRHPVGTGVSYIGNNSIK
jgi:hypothetical protein